MKAMLTDFV